MRIVITEFMDAPAVASLAVHHNTHYDKGLVDRPQEVREQLASAQALIVRNRTQVNAELLQAAPLLRVVGRLGVGLDNIDLDACRARSIEVIPATGANAIAVAEYVIACAMMLLRGVYFSTDAVAAGRWPRTALSNGREISGKTLGVVGFGDIGRRVARMARGLGMEVIGADTQLSPEAPVWQKEDVAPQVLETLLRQSDVVTLHVPLNDATRNLIGERQLASLKPDAVLVNTARGGVVNESALAMALREGRLGGAALDVFHDEPLPTGSPLEGCPRLILTPHVAGVTVESNERVSTFIAHRVAEFLATLPTE